MTETPAQPLSTAEEAELRRSLEGDSYWIGPHRTARLLATLDAERAATREDAGAGLDTIIAEARMAGPSGNGGMDAGWNAALNFIVRRLAAARLPDQPRERIVDITGVDEIEAAVLRSLLDEVETLCDENGHSAIRTDDLAALIHARIATPPAPTETIG